MTSNTHRRGFLRGLATLPLIGGSVAILGRPTATAVPVTDDLLWSYKSWLFFEHRMVSYELAGHRTGLCHDIERCTRTGSPGDDYHFQWARAGLQGPAGWRDAPQPSTRAALVLSAVGVPLSGGV